MKTYTQKGIYGKKPVYVMETLSDFDEYEKILGKEEIEKYNPNFYIFKEDFKQNIGKVLPDEKQIRYLFNGNPVYVQYKVIGLEDSKAWLDWYWVVQNQDDKRDIRYLLSLRELKKDW